MTMDHALHNCQADTRARELGGLVQALKRPEELIGVRHVETHSVVPNIEGLPAVAAGLAEFDARLRVRPRELHGIRQQVGQRDLE